jgi:hypothetical protein
MSESEIICAYCNSRAILVGGDRIYPHRKDLYSKNFWYCDNGHNPAYVGCHGDTRKPLGRLADSELRYWKSSAHRYFDPVWKQGKLSRSSAYKKLARLLKIQPEHCHIGMFDIYRCKKVIELVKGGYL